LENLKNPPKIGKYWGKIGRIHPTFKYSLSFKKDNKHIERGEHVPSSLEDEKLALIEIKPSRLSLKPKLIQIQQGDRIR